MGYNIRNVETAKSFVDFLYLMEKSRIDVKTMIYMLTIYAFPFITIGEVSDKLVNLYSKEESKKTILFLIKKGYVRRNLNESLTTTERSNSIIRNL